jgi:ribosome-binding ATPase YchF (GTP1/OBG family)
LIRNQKRQHDELHSEFRRNVSTHTETTRHLERTRAAHSTLESKAREEIEALQAELKKAVQVTEHLEKIREDQQRSAEAKMWDLKEKLDYAEQSRRSLKNYADHVRDGYQENFDSASARGRSMPQ